MLLHVKRMRIEIASDHALAWEYFRHRFTQHVRDDAQEYTGDIDCLRLEVEDFLQHGCEDRQSKPSWSNVSITVQVRVELLTGRTCGTSTG